MSRMVRLHCIAIALSVCLTIAPDLQAQSTGRVVGRVVDAEQGNPIAGAPVEIIGTTLSTTTALDGRYAVQGVPEGLTSVRVRMIGFAPKLVTGVDVRAGRTAVQDIALSATAVQ